MDISAIIICKHMAHHISGVILQHSQSLLLMSKHNWQPLPYHPRNTNKYDRNYLNGPILTHHHQPLLSPEVMVMVVVMVIVILPWSSWSGDKYRRKQCEGWEGECQSCRKANLNLISTKTSPLAASDQTKVRLDLIPDKGQGEGSWTCIVTYNF